MGERTQYDVSSLIAPLKVLLILATVVCLLSTLVGWVIGLPIQSALAVVEDTVPTSGSPTPAPVTESLSPWATPEPTADGATETSSSSQPEGSAETAVEVPTATPDPAPTPAAVPLEYTVQEGDTLATIARAYNVPVEDLVAVNGLADPDMLYVGQMLAMPDSSAPAPTATPSDDAPEPGPTAVPAEPTPIPLPDSPAAINEGRWIDVDLSEQRLTAYEGHVPVRATLVSTGLPGTPTPVGQFRIWIKLRYDDMAGADYYIEDVPYVMYFHQGYGLHGVTWHGNFGHPMSHGCVNLPTEEAEWLFNFAELGTLVNIHD
jgi:lipoprotein-anchoring transpeptidase ErfK/SrfK